MLILAVVDVVPLLVEATELVVGRVGAFGLFGAFGLLRLPMVAFW